MKRKEFDEYMCKEFPEIFKDRNAPMSQTCMCWGFDVGEGWHDLLIEACKRIKNICDETGLRVYADQVKEKFGTLRFYWSSTSENIKPEYKDKVGDLYNTVENIVCEAEDISAKTCEECGEKGTQNRSGWVTTLCDTCREKRGI